MLKDRKCKKCIDATPTREKIGKLYELCICGTWFAYQHRAKHLDKCNVVNNRIGTQSNVLNQQCQSNQTPATLQNTNTSNTAASVSAQSITTGDRNASSGTTVVLKDIPLITSDLNKIVVNTPQPLLIGTADSLYTSYKNQNRNYLGQIDNTQLRRSRINDYLIALQKYTKCKNIDRIILETDICKNALDAMNRKSYHEGVVDGINLIKQHLESVSDLAASLMTGAAYNRLIHLITLTHTEKVNMDEEELKKHVEETKAWFTDYC